MWSSHISKLIWLFGLAAAIVDLVILFWPSNITSFTLRLHALVLTCLYVVCVGLMAAYLFSKRNMKRER